MMGALDVVELTALMALTEGRREVGVGLIDGPVDLAHPELVRRNIREIPEGLRGTCASAGSVACAHGTFVAGMLCSRRGSGAPAICPGCTLLVRPIFSERSPADGSTPAATPGELAAAIVDCVNAGARVLNLSAALAHPPSSGDRELEQALDHAAWLGVILVAAAGNHGTLASSAITSHPGVIPVAACDRQGRPMSETNLGSSIGRRGLMAPGDGVTSLEADGNLQMLAGTSVAAPFVTGAIALLWSEFPYASASRIRLAVTQAALGRRRAIVPLLLNAWAAYEGMHTTGA